MILKNKFTINFNNPKVNFNNPKVNFNRTIVDLNDSIDISYHTNTSYLYMCKNYKFIDYNDKLNLELSELEKGYLLSIPKKEIDLIKRLVIGYLSLFKRHVLHVLHNMGSSNFLYNKFFNCFLNSKDEDTNTKFNLLILTLRCIVKYRDDNPEAPYLNLDNKYNINMKSMVKEYLICLDSYIRSAPAKNNALIINSISRKDISGITRPNKYMFLHKSTCAIEVYRIFKDNKKITETITEILARVTNPDNTKEQAINSRYEAANFMNAIIAKCKCMFSS